LEKYIIHGGRRLVGDVVVSGAKNAAVAVLPAVILADAPCTVENLPWIEDIHILTDIFKHLNVKVTQISDRRTLIDPTQMRSHKAGFELVSQLRASYYLLGAMLGKFGHAEVALPGGCEIGQRPIDQHIKGLRALGAEVAVEHGNIIAHCKNGLVGTEVYLDVVSVGATINIMLAASKAKGLTTIVNAAKEPHIVDVANFLNLSGASIKGAGTDIIRIYGREYLGGCTYQIIPDQIEAGTYMIAAAATRGDVCVRNVIPTHLEAVSAKLMEMGVRVTEGDDGREFFVRVAADKAPRPVNVKTLPYPGFPTDLQQPIMAMLSTAKGTSVIVENIFEDRFKHVGQLQRMGANISIDNRVAIVEGVKALSGAPICASDLRAGAALVVAALMAQGKTELSHVDFIDRGYESMEQKLAALGADIKRVSDSAPIS
jgi:UDP-N-acetylglucosamine 1-carboxyvinyltransferase